MQQEPPVGGSCRLLPVGSRKVVLSTKGAINVDG